ncbi:hypothetical protein A0H81_14868 [Grifola frondosa]|uniref:Uncharacterized protein n=1 Tax=Grifola frondosa TaxID=5627 RepID=A0A1C7LMA1_GRIFR|nr:hypothetical protein A0H81_14868 [Grifola frondosa]
MISIAVTPREAIIVCPGPSKSRRLFPPSKSSTLTRCYSPSLGRAHFLDPNAIGGQAGLTTLVLQHHWPIDHPIGLPTVR